MKQLAAVVACMASAACTGVIAGAPTDVDDGTGGAPVGAGGAGGAAGQAPASVCAPPPARVWKLTPEQYGRTLATLVPAAARLAALELGPSVAQRKDAFSNPADAFDLSEPYVTSMFELVEAVVEVAPADPAKLAPCLETKAGEPACMREVVEVVATKAFRRALGAEEVTELVAYWEAQAATRATRLLLRRILMAPDALFRTELGAPGASKVAALTADERASALSFFVTDGPPDPELVAAARAGRLSSAEGMRAEAERLVKVPAAAAGVRKLLAELYGLRAAPGLRKNAEVYPAFTPALAAAMTRESELFVEEVLWKDDARLATLMSAGWSVLDASLAAFYGVGTDAKQAFGRTPLPAARRGLLTSASLLARLARENDTDPVARGKFVREVLLCQDLPNVPGDLNVFPPPPDGKRTQRERLAMHSVGDCAPCHRLMDPIGLAFEFYDGIGKYRTTEADKPIDGSGTLTGVEPGEARFADATGLVQLLAQSPELPACFVRKAFEYAHGRPVGPADECAIDRIGRAFAQSGGNILSLMVALASDESFTLRSLP